VEILAKIEETVVLLGLRLQNLDIADFFLDLLVGAGEERDDLVAGDEQFAGDLCGGDIRGG
jgi:hypothetical protein